MEGLLCIEERYGSIEISWTQIRFAYDRLLFIILFVAGENFIARILCIHSSLLLHFVPRHHSAIGLIQYGHSCHLLCVNLLYTALLPSEMAALTTS